jgi:hypothetical protein
VGFKRLILDVHVSVHRNIKLIESFWFPAAAAYVKPEAAITVFELLMMGGMSPETC